MLSDNIYPKDLYGISADSIVEYCKYLYDNNIPTTWTIRNLRSLQFNKGYMPSLRIKVEAKEDNWYIKSVYQQNSCKNFKLIVGEE